MPGKIKDMIDTIIEQRAQGSHIIASTIKIKLILKGINPDKYTAESPDNIKVINKLNKLAEELRLKL